jgi:hypothetical protein
MTLGDLISYIKANRNKGRGEAFGWTDDELITYLHWADSFQYLFVVSDENGFAGCSIMYPVAVPAEGEQAELMTFKANIPQSEEGTADLCIMDFVASSPEAKKSLVTQLKDRYPNWEKQEKWALRFGNIKKISNNYINLLTI